MTGFRRIVIILLVLAYIFSPVNLAAGLLDDAIILLLGFAAIRKRGEYA